MGAKLLKWLSAGAFFLLLVATALPGCGQAEEGGVLEVGHVLNPTSLDPVYAILAGDVFVHAQIYDTLLRYDEQGNIAPWLCTEWEYLDDTTLILHLRDGVKFHDGTDFNAQAVKAHFDRIMGSWRSLLRPALFFYLDSVEAIDDLTVQIKTVKPMGHLLSVLASGTGRISSPAAVEKWGEEYGLKAAVGTGPFKFVRWVQDSEIVLERNEDYWAKDEEGTQLPYLDGIEIKIIPDPATMYSNLVTGYVDLTGGIPPSDYDHAVADPSLKTEVGPLGLTYGILVDCTRPPFDNILARKAVAYAIDKDEILEAVAYGYGVPVGHFIPPGIFGYDPTIEGYPYDPDKARELLADAGYTAANPLRFDAITIRLSGFDVEAEVLQAQLARVGIEMNLEIVDATVMAQRLATHDFTVIPLGTAVGVDPQAALEVVYGENGFYNAGRIVDPELEALIQEAGTTMDRDTRKALYHDIMQLMVDKCYDWWVFGAQAVIAMQDYVTGFTYSITGSGSLANIWLEK